MLDPCSLVFNAMCKYNLLYVSKLRLYIHIYLNVSSFFNGLDKFDLQQNVVTPEMDPRHGTDYHIYFLHCFHQTLMICKGALHKGSPFGLEGQQHLQFIDFHTDFRALEDEGGMALGQACLYYPPSNVACSTHNKNLAFFHLLFSTLVCLPLSQVTTKGLYIWRIQQWK